MGCLGMRPAARLRSAADAPVSREVRFRCFREQSAATLNPGTDFVAQPLRQCLDVVELLQKAPQAPLLSRRCLPPVGTFEAELRLLIALSSRRNADVTCWLP